MLKFFAATAFDLSAVHIGCEFLDLGIRVFDLLAQLSVGGEFRFSQPVMADHPFFIGVRDSARFQIAHRGKRFVDPRPHLVEEIVREFHPADVD